MTTVRAETEWRKLVAAMRQSGQSCARWRKEHDINPKTMGNWTKKFKLEEAEFRQPAFIEVGLSANQAHTQARQRKAAGICNSAPIQLKCAVCTMSFPASIDTDAVRAVLDTMITP